MKINKKIQIINNILLDIQINELNLNSKKHRKINTARNDYYQRNETV